MADSTPLVVRDYLAELDAALADVPQGVRAEIVAGVREELVGLDASTAAARIDELGDPAFIAAEARAEVGVGPIPASTEAGWYPVVAAIVVAIGGALIPVIGWIVGIGMVWASRTWFRWEKWVATLVAPATGILLAGVIWAFWSPQASGGASVNPIVPVFHDAILSTILFVGVINVAVGIWLLWRAKRTTRPQP